MLTRRSKLSSQIFASLLIVFGASLLGLVLVGQNAISLADGTSLARQERFAARQLETAIEAIPQQQRSSTVWDEAVEKTLERDETWLDENLGAWMQDYFGHHENYILDQTGAPVFASVSGEIRVPASYAARAEVIAPVVARLRDIMAQVSVGEDDPYKSLAEVAVVTPLRLSDKVAIVSAVPIISDSGDIRQVPGTEAVHVAVRYVDAKLAGEIGLPIELPGAAFQASLAKGLAGIPVIGPTGDVLSWLTWKPVRPGTDLLMTMLPVLLAVGLASATLFLWMVRRLLRVSNQLQAREAQALLDVAALKRANQAAEAADRAKMNFMSIVSHELRTPLTVILGYARLGKNLRQMTSARRLADQLQQRPVDANIVKSGIHEVLHSAETSMEKIERSGEHLLFLVNQLLDYAKMETGRLEVDPEICDVRDVLEPVVEQMRILTEQKDLHLETQIPPCLMLADVTRTRQILINLMGNAIKFTDRGKVSVVVTESSEKVHIAVRDTGVGIEPRELEKIFEAFHQADLTLSRSAAGTGLGLSVAKELARLEGGTIDVRSEVGVGSTFTLSLPKETPAVCEQAA
ncbi:histidine kinase [Sulfitobacter alexandrii]|uniref:histidine kinase n=1 Tax=Sulfitobacter alexandrii TaxID=1917485 RepID=A0A1J0WGV4_9RHOB|nr:ATP-binding protein [Sulfitobacter alexandrii]APE43539.1 histidine kinase [Sulfitobacter alexandrii]